MSDTDSDISEEFTSQEGLQQDQELRKVQIENKARLVREGKERRREWAEKLTPRSKPKEVESEMLPNEIVKILAANEKKIFTSDSEDEKVEKKSTSKKRMPNKSGLETVILKEIPPAKCVQSSLEFLKKRKMQVSRSSAVLNNSNQVLRLLSKSGLLK